MLVKHVREKFSYVGEKKICVLVEKKLSPTSRYLKSVDVGERMLVKSNVGKESMLVKDSRW